MGESSLHHSCLSRLLLFEGTSQHHKSSPTPTSLAGSVPYLGLTASDTNQEGMSHNGSRPYVLAELATTGMSHIHLSQVPLTSSRLCVARSSNLARPQSQQLSARPAATTLPRVVWREQVDRTVRFRTT